MDSQHGARYTLRTVEQPRLLHDSRYISEQRSTPGCYTVLDILSEQRRTPGCYTVPDILSKQWSTPGCFICTYTCICDQLIFTRMPRLQFDTTTSRLWVQVPRGWAIFATQNGLMTMCRVFLHTVSNLFSQLIYNRTRGRSDLFFVFFMLMVLMYPVNTSFIQKSNDTV